LAVSGATRSSPPPNGSFGDPESFGSRAAADPRSAAADAAAFVVRGRHERPLVQERQHFGVDVLALLLPGRGEDERPVQQRPGGSVHERPRVDVVEHDGVRVPEPVKQRVSHDRVVL
jgi:hypothetical protein